MAEGNELKARHWPAEDHDFVQVNGEGIPPLYVRAGAIDAVGVYGEKAALIVLDSGKELVAKGTTPAEVIGLLALPDED